MDNDWDDAAFAQLDAIEASYNCQARQPLQNLGQPPPPPPPPLPPPRPQPQRLPLHVPPPQHHQHLPPRPLQLQPASAQPAPFQPPRSSDTQNAMPPPPAPRPPMQPQPMPPPPPGWHPPQRQPADEDAWVPHAVLRQQLLPGAPIPHSEAPSQMSAAAAQGALLGSGMWQQQQQQQQQWQQQPGPSSAASAANLPPRPEAQPFDPETIGTWIFPTMATERRYQFEISATAVRHNTLVSLPTGLGKTLIASVVMYNLQRWFPTGRCCFLAPTKPLVHQQVSAVRRTTGLPLSAFAELTGHMKAEEREKAWGSARMLFLTPQTLANDMETGVCPAHEIVCVVVDEAHKATGNHAYVQVASMLSRRSGGFRLLALSATPGQNVEKIQEVVTKLRIHRLEARDETSIDVMGCINERVQQTLKLPLEGDVAAARDAVGRVYSITLRRLHGLVHETDIHKMPRFMIITAQVRGARVPAGAAFPC
jgi:hypothetical protein